MKALLDTRSDFSLGESLLKPSEIAKSAKSLGYDVVALTDTMTISGLPSFMQTAEKEGIKSIIGARLRIYHNMNTDKHNKPYFIRVLCFTEKSVQALMGLLSKGFTKDRFFRIARLMMCDVYEAFADCKNEILLTTGDAYSILADKSLHVTLPQIIENGIPIAVDLVSANTDYYLRHNNVGLLTAKKYALPCLLCSPSFYKEKESTDALDVMKCITRPGAKMNDMSTHDQFKDWVPKDKKQTVLEIFNSCEAGNKRFGTGISTSEIKQIIASALKFEDEVSEKATYAFKQMPPALPKMSEDDFDMLKKKCIEGWKRLSEEVFGYKPSDLSEYKKRLGYELSLIKSKGFSAYFLLVADVTTWCSKNNIRVGFGRGSVGGSLVAFLLGITDVDPIRFNLLFERFINPARHDLPDIDLDFQSSRREDVIKYITQKYGEDYVAGVSNYTTIAGAGALSDVCKRMGVEKVPAFGAWFEKEHGVSVSLTEAIEKSPQLAKFASEHPDEAKYAETLEGTLRSFGKHAAGIIVAGVPIDKRAVVEKRSDANVVCWDKRSCEDFGLIKLDILGLSNLDIIGIASEHLKNLKGIDFDMTKIRLDDERVLKEFGEGKTTGVFQFASQLMAKILRDMYASGSITFDDLCAATALGRPGPLDAGFTEEYVKRKNGESAVTYPHPSAENSMKATYGVLVYQETIMRAVQDVAGMTPVEAEGVRRATGKKDLEKMKSYKDKFIAGAMAGFVEVTLEDGTKVKVHRAKKLQCSDGKERTIEEALAEDADVTGGLN